VGKIGVGQPGDLTHVTTWEQRSAGRDTMANVLNNLFGGKKSSASPDPAQAGDSGKQLIFFAKLSNHLLLRFAGNCPKPQDLALWDGHILNP
jgi:hypothetical protein